MNTSEREHVEVDSAVVQVPKRYGELFSMLSASATGPDLCRALKSALNVEVESETDLHALLVQLLGKIGLVLVTSTNAEGNTLYAAKRSADERVKPFAVNYRITLVSGRILKVVSSTLSFLFNPYVMALLSVAAVAIVGLRLVGAGDSVLSLSWILDGVRVDYREAAISYVCIMFSVLVHELGHCAAGAHFGKHAKRIGLGFYFGLPVIFADVSTIWSLPNKSRAVVDLGGIYFQAMLAAVCVALLDVSGSAVAQKVLLVTAIFNGISVIVNLDPFLKRDGYWLFSDIFNEQNLHKKFVCLTKSWLMRDPTLCPANVRNSRVVRYYSIAANAYGVTVFAAAILIFFKYAQFVHANYSGIFYTFIHAARALDIYETVSYGIELVAYSLPVVAVAILGLTMARKYFFKRS